jgi:hypothetical protein
MPVRSEKQIVRVGGRDLVIVNGQVLTKQEAKSDA